MAVQVIEAIADAIMRFEGWEPGSRSYRNRNPGNLRASSLSLGKDPDGYAVFRRFPVGYSAVVQDLLYKVLGQNDHGLSSESTLLELFEVYAPSGDHNAPRTYAAFVADWLRRVYGSQAITLQTKIRHIYEIVGQEVPDVEPAA